MKAFREAIEAALDGGDFDAVEALLADDVVFTSPVAFKPYPGKAITAAILRGVGRVFTDFRYLREIEDEPHSALVFETKVGDVLLNGCDFITTNADGLISEFTVMVRPLKAANALAEAMAAEFEQIQAEAIAALQQQGAQQ
jgi:ketosteroid isomerase-like protein